jgi:hypothetical protein
LADKTGTVGSALTPIDVTGSFADVDTAVNGETATYSAKLVDSTGNLVNGGNLPSWLQIDPATGIVTGMPPAGTPAGDIYVRAIRTDAGGLSASDVFKIALAAAADTTPPTIAITSNQASLTTGQTATITFTLSEASTDFIWDGSVGDIVVTGGMLSALTPVSGSNGTQYTATFTPAANSSGTATIGVQSDKFSDAAGNDNLDTYLSTATAPEVIEGNNQVSLAYNTVVNRNATIDIVSIHDGLSGTTDATGSKDTGASLSDFNTSDQTLTYTGTITGWTDGLGDRVMLQFLDSNGQQIGSDAFVPQSHHRQRHRHHGAQPRSAHQRHQRRHERRLRRASRGD